LDRANLEGTNLEGVHLDNSSLAGANLEGANLMYASLKNTSLVGANLRRANLSHATMTGADITNADITGAILDDVNHSKIIGLTREMVLSASWKPNNRSYDQICTGGQDSFAAQYQETKGVHPLITNLYIDEIFSAWEPSHISETELVLCVRYDHRVIETCSYYETVGPYVHGPTKVTIARIQHVATATLHEARSGTAIDQRVWYGGEPGNCPTQVASDSSPYQEFDGPTVELNPKEIYQWLIMFVVRE
jgi:hypothetical protein